jgi:hypothetical protein
MQNFSPMIMLMHPIVETELKNKYKQYCGIDPEDRNHYLFTQEQQH